MPTLAEKLSEAIVLVHDSDDLIHDGLSELYDKLRYCSSEHLEHICQFLVIIGFLGLQEYFFMQYALLEEIHARLEELVQSQGQGPGG